MGVRQYRIKSFVMESGERYCALVDKTSLPLYYPNLFVTTQIRNYSLSVAAMESALTGLNVFFGACNRYGIDLETRFLDHRFLVPHELDAIRDYCQRRLASDRSNSSARPILVSSKHKQSTPETVASETQYMRLTWAAKYSTWLAETLLSRPVNRKTTRDTQDISRMQKQLESRRPKRRGRNRLTQVNGLDEEQVKILLEVIRPGSEANPFRDPAIQLRNCVAILILLHLGNRGGELLNIRTRDIDWANNQLVIVRRADEKADTRLDQPLAKTLDRRLPMKDTLAEIIHRYVTQYRKKVKNARLNDYLFVTHKAGPTQGQALSKSGYQKMIKKVACAAMELADLHGHTLRHTWNDRFSRLMDQMENAPSHETQEMIRSTLQGWKQGSGTAATYNNRFIEAKAMEIALTLNEGSTRIPENLGK